MLADAIAQAQASGDVTAELRSMFNLATLHYEAGEVAEAREVYEQTSGGRARRGRRGRRTASRHG